MKLERYIERIYLLYVDFVFAEPARRLIEMGHILRYFYGTNLT